MADPLRRSIRILDVGYAYSAQPPLFVGVNAELRAGEVVALVGPSGSGKSTLLAVLAGMLQPTQGRIERHRVQRIAWVFQNPHGVPGRTAIDHVALPMLARGLTHIEARREARTWLTRVGLLGKANAAFRELSGGEAQRLMLARGMATHPDLLLVDEPTAQLDRSAADTVNASIRGLSESGTLVVIATHDEHTKNACTAVVDLASTEHAPAQRVVSAAPSITGLSAEGAT